MDDFLQRNRRKGAAALLLLLLERRKGAGSLALAFALLSGLLLLREESGLVAGPRRLLAGLLPGRPEPAERPGGQAWWEAARAERREEPAAARAALRRAHAGGGGGPSSLDLVLEGPREEDAAAPPAWQRAVETVGGSIAGVLRPEEARKLPSGVALSEGELQDALAAEASPSGPAREVPRMRGGKLRGGATPGWRRGGGAPLSAGAGATGAGDASAPRGFPEAGIPADETRTGDTAGGGDPGAADAEKTSGPRTRPGRSAPPASGEQARRAAGPSLRWEGGGGARGRPGVQQALARLAAPASSLGQLTRGNALSLLASPAPDRCPLDACSPEFVRSMSGLAFDGGEPSPGLDGGTPDAVAALDPPGAGGAARLLLERAAQAEGELLRCATAEEELGPLAQRALRDLAVLGAQLRERCVDGPTVELCCQPFSRRSLPGRWRCPRTFSCKTCRDLLAESSQRCGALNAVRREQIQACPANAENLSPCGF